MKTPGHAMTAQAGAVAYIKQSTLDKLPSCKYIEAAVFPDAGESRTPLYLAPPAAVPVEALEGLVDAIRPVASMPLEEYAAFDNAPDNKCIFGANDWNLTVGDIRRLRAALANIERLIKERSNG